MPTKPAISINLGQYPATRALHAGEIASDFLTLEHSGVRAVWNEFAAMIRELKFDVSEMSLVSFLQAKAFGKPLVLLPIVITGWAQHGYIGYNSKYPALSPKDLEGKRVGIRSITQTSGIWARSILKNEHGVDLDKIQWVCVEEPHLAEFKEPANMEYERSGRTLAEVLLAGEIDASILGPDMHRHEQFRPVIADADAAAARWQSKHGVTQFVHMAVVTEELAKARPDLICEVYAMLMASRNAATAEDRTKFANHPAGFENVRPGLELMIAACHDQNFLPRSLSVEELFDETTIGLGKPEEI